MMSSGSGLCENCTSLLTPPPHYKSPHSDRAAELLVCNDPPLAYELAAFKHDIAGWESMLNDLNQRTVRVQALLDALVAVCTTAEARLKDTQSLFRPICHMPNEILMQIFHNCIPQWPASPTDYNAFDLNTAPWTLTRVCQRWRNLARSLPHLWTYVNVDRYPQRLDTVVKVKIFLDLSGDVPISVNIRCQEGLVALRGSEHRWKSLRSALSKDAYRQLDGTSFTSLETLHVSHLKALVGTPLDIFNARTAPNLRTFTGSSAALQRLELPWTQLTELNLWGNFEPPAAPLIERMTSLERVSMITPSEEFSVPIILPRVSYLSLSERVEVRTGSLKNLLEHMILPMLCSLRIMFQESDPAVSRESYYPNMLDSALHLTTLHIDIEMSDPITNVELLLEFLALTPRVKHFKIRNSYLTESFILGMTYATGRPFRLPEMTNLDMGLNGLLDIEPWAEGNPAEVICRMIESRMGPSGDANAFQAPSAVLQEVCLPRWMYRQAAIWSSERWSAIRSAMKVFCVMLRSDID